MSDKLTEKTDTGKPEVRLLDYACGAGTVSKVRKKKNTIDYIPNQTHAGSCKLHDPNRWT
jgi:hypothetical protein